MKKRNGFSLVEILVVITIIAILGALSVGFAQAIQKSGRDAQRESDIRVLQSALQQYYADQNFYPDTMVLTAGAPLNNCTGRTGCSVTRTYLTATPKDPTGTAPYCYTSLLNSAAGAASCASGPPGQCHFYQLNAKLETSPGATLYTCNGNNTYNFKVTPL